MANQWTVKKSGGAREGAGRKKIGKSVTVSITLPEEQWLAIDNSGVSKAEYFRNLHQESIADQQMDFAEIIKLNSGK